MPEIVEKVPGGLKAKYAGKTHHDMGRITLSGMTARSPDGGTDTGTNTEAASEVQDGKASTDTDTTTTLTLDKLSAKIASLDQKQKQQMRFAVLGLSIFYIAASFWSLLYYQAAKPEDATGSVAETDRLAEQVREDSKNLKHMYTFQDKILRTITLYSSQGPIAASAMTQSVLDTAKTPEEADKLVAFGDQLYRDGNFAMSEQYYRKAISIFGLTVGPMSRQYMEAMQRLALVCHTLKRFEEEEEIQQYLKRLM